MIIKITSNQFRVLLNNFSVLKEKGLAFEMNSKTFDKILKKIKLFRVKMWLGGIPTQIVVNAGNSAQALVLARKMYPTAKIISAREI